MNSIKQMITPLPLMLLLMVRGSVGCVVMHSIKGMIGLIPRNSNCSYQLNGNPISSMDLTASRSYGLIQASCDDCITSHVSTFEGCDDCWICAHNEGLEGCRSRAVPILLGVIISLLAILALVFMYAILDKKLCLTERMITCCHSRSEMRKAVKEERRDRRLERALQKRLMIQPDLSQPSVTEETREERSEIRTSGSRHLGGSVSPGVLLALGLLSSSQVRACDNVLFVSSSGGLYTDGSLANIATGLAYLHTGNTLCFKHADGGQEELKVDQVTMVDNYGASYRTCDFTMDFMSYSVCLGSDLCWNSKECHQGVRYSAVGPKAYVVLDAQTGCRLVPNMDNPCTYRQKCVWFYWDLMPIKDRCDTIYHLLGQTKIVHFTYTSANGNVFPFSLSPEKPYSSEPMTIHLGPVDVEYYPQFHSVRRHGDIPLGVGAAKKNEGLAGLLGDFQIPLIESGNTSSWSYPLHDVNCQPDGRTVMCRTAPPAYSSTILDNSRNVLEGSFDEAGLFFKRVRHTRGVVSVMLRSSPITGQVVEQASCDLQVESSYGCTSCDEMPYIIVRPSTVRRTGMVQFNSNCTFFLPEISCTDQPQILRLTHRPEVCKLDFQDTNQTLIINIKYEFLGQIYYRGVMAFKPEENFSGKMKLAMQSPDFLSSLQYSMAIGFASAAAMGLIKALLKYLAFRKGVEDQKKLSV